MTAVNFAAQLMTASALFRNASRAVVLLLIAAMACTRERAPEPVVPSNSAAAETTRTYHVQVGTPPALTPKIGTTLTFQVVDQNNQPATLRPIGDSLLHVVAVNTSLTWYQHVDPADAGDDTFESSVTFPAAGEYVLYVTYAVAGSEQAIDRYAMNVGARTSSRRPLRLTTLNRSVNGYEVALSTDPKPPHAGSWTTLKFHVSRQGNPVDDIEGASALSHLVIVGEDAREWVLSHSTVEEAAGGVRAGAHTALHPSLANDPHERLPLGPDLTFHVFFPRRGRYKIWTNFRRSQERIAPDFVIDVGG